MSAYITQYCIKHGEWEADVDNIGECPECERAGQAEVQRLRAENQQLKEELESHAWEISPAMAQAQIDQLRAENAHLKEINQTLWAHLTPEVRHELNIRWQDKEAK